MLVAYADLKKAFNSVNREAFWNFLCARKIPTGIIGLLSGLYFGTESVVKFGVSVSYFFPVYTGVRQGCILGPSLLSHGMST